MNILWLDDPRSRDASLVGGKVANLSRFADSFRVPSGFCVCTEAGTTRSDNGLASAVVEACLKLGPELAVAVRSSATDEDGIATSFAGIHETYLNVRGPEAVVESVLRCLESFTTERALTYRREQSLVPPGRVAVLVQELVEADASAVAFTADPVSSDTSRVVVNSSWGLGESIVSGTVTPDTFVVSKQPLSVLDRNIGDKRRMTVPIDFGAREVGVPRVMRDAPSLSDDQVLATAELAIALERRCAIPVDIECAWRSDELYLLQCRPITTMATNGKDR